MLLARQGYAVLLVDRARFPSDTVSTHLIHPPGVAALGRWGLLERLTATGCPSIDTYSFDFGPIVITGSPGSSGTASVSYCPRRTVLDALLVEAAREARVEVREGFSVSEVLTEDGAVVGIRGHSSGGPSVTERARVVIGADGARSGVANAVAAERYQDHPVLAVAYYAYWSGFPTAQAQWVIRPGHGFGAFPTNDGLTMLLVAWPYCDFADVKKDVERRYEQALRTAYGDRLETATRETKVVGSGVANHFREPYGPGWALVGDAGYLKDPVTAQGITDAFHDAESCAAALGAAFSGAQPFDSAMAEYRRARDARVQPAYDFALKIANLAEPAPPQLQELLSAIAGNQPAMNKFTSMFAGTFSPAEFFDPRHIGSLVGASP